MSVSVEGFNLAAREITTRQQYDDLIEKSKTKVQGKTQQKLFCTSLFEKPLNDIYSAHANCTFM